MANDAQRRVAQLVRLADDAYFTLDPQRRMDLEGRLNHLFGRMGFTAPPPEPAASLPFVMGLGAPLAVDLRRHGDVPVLIALRQSGQRQWEVHPDQNLLLVASDVRRGEVRAAQPSAAEGKRMPSPTPSGSGPRPEAEEGPAVSSEIRRAELGAVVRWQPRPARLAVTAVMWDQRSNTVAVEVAGPDGTAAALPPRPASAFLGPGAAATASPPPPGAALSIAPSAKAGGPVAVRGSVALPLDRAAVAPAAGSGGGKVLLGTLLLVQLDEPIPLRIDLAIPADVRGNEVQASFGFDLVRAAAGHALAGAYQAYLVVGDVVAGPQPVAIGAK